VNTTPVVMFEKTNTTEVKFSVPCGTTKVVNQVVTVMFIGFTAGAFAGTRTPSTARVTQTITRSLIRSCLFKSVPSRCWV